MTMPILTIAESLGHGLGGLCYWNSKRCNRENLRRATEQVGCDKFVPSVPPRSTVLRDSLLACARIHFGRVRGQQIMVRELKERGAFQAVRVIPGATVNDFQHLVSVRYSNADQWQVQVVGGAGMYDFEAMLQRAVLEARDFLPASIVSQIMVRMLRHWKATLLKDDGGLWFLPGDRLMHYRLVADWLTGGDCPQFHVTQFEVASDSDTIHHVLSQLRAEVTAGINEIMQDVLNAEGGMQDRSIKVRMDRADAFLAKVRAYEGFTNSTLTDLVIAVDKAQQALAVNRLLSAAV